MSNHLQPQATRLMQEKQGASSTEGSEAQVKGKVGTPKTPFFQKASKWTMEQKTEVTTSGPSGHTQEHRSPCTIPVHTGSQDLPSDLPGARSLVHRTGEGTSCWAATAWSGAPRTALQTEGSHFYLITVLCSLRSTN